MQLNKKNIAISIDAMPRLFLVLKKLQLYPTAGQRTNEHNGIMLRPCLVSKKFPTVPVTSNLLTHAWSIKWS